MWFVYPTEAEWAQAEATWDLARLNAAFDKISNVLSNNTSIEAFIWWPSLHDWCQHLRARIDHTRKSYVFARFNFDLGIPDDPWFVSPGRDGRGTEFFPNFEEKHFWHKMQFDFYGDVFYYKWFSAFDTLGQILNLIYNLKLSLPTFASAVARLETVDPSLFADLQSEVTKQQSFKTAKQFRNDMTHNYLPGRSGGSVECATTDNGTSVSLGIGQYVPTKLIMANMVECFELLAVAMELIADRYPVAGVVLEIPGSLPTRRIKK